MRCRSCFINWSRTTGNPRFKGWLIHQGYVYILCHGHPRASRKHYVKRADLIAEIMLGRPLHPNEVVHHTNKARNDDTPSNLEVIDREKHYTYREALWGADHPHWTGGAVCPNCGGKKEHTSKLCQACHTSTGRAKEQAQRIWANREKKHCYVCVECGAKKSADGTLCRSCFTKLGYAKERAQKRWARKKGEGD